MHDKPNGSVAAVEVAALIYRQGGGFLRGLRHFMVLMKITDRPAVGDDMALEAPFSS